MEVYLVGGAVRDEQLGLPITEKDWVLVGATHEELMKLGFQQVGKSFPVYLHPDTKEEYAMARRESKVAGGYHGFEFDTGEDVTLEEDLKRRDLTINAMAKNANGEIIDPFGGLKDLAERTLRHVSEAFSEDPVRVLRVARFMAKFEKFGFNIAKDTIMLMQEMVLKGELEFLVPERIFKELGRALELPAPVAFIQTLHQCGALKIMMPELEKLYSVPQNPEIYPEVMVGTHTELTLRQAALLTDSPTIRFACLMHDVGKSLTPKEHYPDHPEHETLATEIIKNYARSLGMPNEFRDLAIMVAKYNQETHLALKWDADTILKFINKLDAIRKKERFLDFLLACKCIFKGRLGKEYDEYPQSELLILSLNAAIEIKAKDVLEGMDLTVPEEIQAAIFSARLKVVESIASEFHARYAKIHRR